jgi:hypothetical protein
MAHATKTLYPRILMKYSSTSPGCRQTAMAAIGGVVLAVVLVGCKRSPEATSTSPAPSSQVPQAKTAPTIVASPNPVPAGSSKFGTTTISWDTGNGSVGEVYVSVNGGSEKRFSGALVKGTQNADWIGKGEYEFRLYAGKEHKTLLASVKVTREKK